jgi:hypothetical protein
MLQRTREDNSARIRVLDGEQIDDKGRFRGQFRSTRLRWLYGRGIRATGQKQKKEISSGRLSDNVQSAALEMTYDQCAPSSLLNGLSVEIVSVNVWPLKLNR